MKKRVFLLAVSCKNGGLCPGGVDLDNPKEWIRIVRDDGQSGAVQWHEIDFAKPLDVIEFDGRPMPQGKQRENWVIDNHSCKKVGTEPLNRVMQAFKEYGYHGFWSGFSFMRKDEFEAVTQPSESIMLVSDVRLYKNDNGKAKIDFRCVVSDNFRNVVRLVKGVSLTDQDFYDKIDADEICYKHAIIVVSIPKEADWIHPETGELRAYKFVSKVFGSNQ